MFVALIVIIHTMLRLLAKYVLSRNLSSRQGTWGGLLTNTHSSGRQSILIPVDIDQMCREGLETSAFHVRCWQAWFIIDKNVDSFYKISKTCLEAFHGPFATLSLRISPQQPHLIHPIEETHKCPQDPSL